MSEIGLNINVDSYNNEGIKTIKGNNNAEIYKLYILKNKRRLSLVGKTVKLGYVMAETTKGDIIENLNITNAEQGEITFPITNRISKQDGVYSCQLAIYGADEFLEYTATFGLTVEDNIFTKIAGEIENSKDLTYIERILDEAKTVSGDLKTNIPVATNLNSSLESNISNARNINTTLSDTTEKSKVAATDAIEKKSQLESSITKAKEFIDGLDGSQNIPSIRMELTELQNGLKSNQALEYSGSYISANDTLEGRTEGVRIGGRTLQNILLQKQELISQPTKLETSSSTAVGLCSINGKYYELPKTLKANTTYTIIPLIDIANNSFGRNELYVQFNITGMSSPSLFRIYQQNFNKPNIITSPSTIETLTNSSLFFGGNSNDSTLKSCIINKFNLLIIEGAINFTSKYFEGLKSFGEAEKEGDKYKISILSCGKNLAKLDLNNKNITPFEDGYRLDCVALYRGDEDIFNLKGKYKENTQYVLSYYGKILDNSNANNYRIRVYYTDNTYTDGVVTGNKYEKRIIKTLSGKTVYKIIGYYGSMNGDFIVKDVMLEEGTQATQYESYKCDKKDILLKEPLKEGDYIYEDNGQVKVYRPTKQYTFTGDENFQKINVYGDVIRIDFACSDIKPSGYIVSNNFAKGIIGKENLECINIHANSKYVQFQIKLNKLTSPDVEGFKAWLKSNPTTIVYQLATPVLEIVENCVDIDLDTYQDKTYFSIENSLKGTLDFKVPSNIGSVVQNMAKEVNNIWDVINNLLVPSIVKANGNLAMLKLNNNLN